MPFVIEGRVGKRKIPKAKEKTRPILARVKKSLFSSIELKGAWFLDLYAGSGSVGIEALSRGVAYCVFVERDKEQCQRIRNALAILSLKNARVICCNTFSLRLKELFDIIFLGPPYKDFLVNKTIRLIDKRGFLKDGGLVIAQHHKKEEIEKNIGPFVLLKQKSFGETILSFYKKL